MSNSELLDWIGFLTTLVSFSILCKAYGRKCAHAAHLEATLKEIKEHCEQEQQIQRREAAIRKGPRDAFQR